MSTLPPPPGDHGTDEPTEQRAPLPPPPSGDDWSGDRADSGPDAVGGHRHEGPGSPSGGQWGYEQGGYAHQQQSWGGHEARYRPAMSPSDERTWAMLAHLSGLSFLFGLPVIGPLVVWLLKREQSAIVDAEGKEALNFSLSVLLYSVVGGILGGLLTAVTFGLGIIPVGLVGLAAAAAWLVVTILAAVSASDGKPYRYPLTIRFVK